MIIILYRRLWKKVLLSIIIKLENKRKNFSKHCIDRDIPHKVVKCRCTRKISIAIVIISLLILLSLIVILPLLLIKLNSNRLKSTPSLRWNTTGITVAGVFKTPGSTNNQLYQPYDIALDSMNNLYVADYCNCRIQRFDIDEHCT